MYRILMICLLLAGCSRYEHAVDGMQQCLGDFLIRDEECKDSFKDKCSTADETIKLYECRKEADYKYKKCAERMLNLYMF